MHPEAICRQERLEEETVVREIVSLYVLKRHCSISGRVRVEHSARLAVRVPITCPDVQGSRTSLASLLLLPRAALRVLQAALTTELRELSSGVRIYGRDRWNVLDLLALVLLTAGLVCRIASKDSSWGRGFYALSAPVVVSRILFFVQLFRFQGPMVQVGKGLSLWPLRLSGCLGD